MKLATLLRWDLVQTARGEGSRVALTIVALASAGLVGVGILILGIWSPFTLTPTFGNRPDPGAVTFVSIVGEHRGAVAFLIVMFWLLLVATAIGPAFTAGSIVRDRRAGRLDRVLLDVGRADIVVLGKLLASLIPLLTVLLVAAPAISFSWLIGGITKSDAIAEVVTLVLLVILIAAIGSFCSALASTEAVAILASYTVVSFVVWGPLLAAMALAAEGMNQAANLVAAFDPAVGLLAGQPELMRSLVHLVPGNLPEPPLVWSLGAPIKATVPIWAVDALVYAVLSAALLWLSGVALEPLHPLKTWRLRHSLAGAR